MTVGLSRDAKHVYIAAYPEPVILPSVTTIMRVLDKPAIVPWAQGIVAEAAIAHRGELESWVSVGGVEGAVSLLRKAAETKRDAAASIGSSVHALAEAIVKGQPVTVPEDQAPFVSAYQRWIEAFQPEFLAVEEMVVGDGYAGTLDSIAVIAGETWLLDIKTSRGGPYKDTALQLAAYGAARFIGRPNDPQQYAIPKIEQYGVIRVRPEGAELVPFDIRPDTYAAFRAALEMWRWFDGPAKSTVQQPIGPALLHFPNPARVEAIA